MDLKFRTIIIYLCLGIFVAGCAKINTDVLKKESSAYLHKRAPENQSVDEDAIESVQANMHNATSGSEDSNGGNYYAFNRNNEEIKYYKPQEVFAEKKEIKKSKKITKPNVKIDQITPPKPAVINPAVKPVEVKQEILDDEPPVSNGSIVKVILPNANALDPPDHVDEKSGDNLMDEVRLPGVESSISSLDIEKDVAFLEQDLIPDNGNAAPILSKKKNNVQTIQQNGKPVANHDARELRTQQSYPTRKEIPKTAAPDYRASGKIQYSTPDYRKNEVAFDTYHPESRPLPLPFEQK